MKKISLLLLSLLFASFAHAQNDMSQELRMELLQAGYQPAGLTDFAIKELTFRSSQLNGNTDLPGSITQYDGDILVADPGSGISAKMKTNYGMTGIADEVAIELKYAVYSFYAESPDPTLNSAAPWSYKAVAIRCLQYNDPTLQNLDSNIDARLTAWCGFKKTSTKF